MERAGDLEWRVEGDGILRVLPRKFVHSFHYMQGHWCWYWILDVGIRKVTCWLFYGMHEHPTLTLYQR